MSWWTEVLLTASVLEDRTVDDGPPFYPAFDVVNKWLNENHGPRSELFRVKPDDPTRHAPFSCFAGAFKSLDYDGFIDAVKAAPWHWKEQVQLFMRHEDDNGFAQIGLWDDDR